MKGISRTLALIVALIMLGACSGKQAGELDAEELDVVAEKTALSARAFTFTRRFGGVDYKIEGLVEDDYRYSAKVTVDDELVLEEVVIDDARYLRVANADMLRTVAVVESVDRPLPPRPGSAFADPATETALLTGGWVFDPTAAPAEFGGAASSGNALDANQLLNRVRFIETLPAVMHRGQGVGKWNPEATDYLPQQDRFKPIKAENLGDPFIDRYRSSGFRYDVKPKPFDPAVSPTGLRDLEDFFLYTSVWTKGAKIRRVGRVFELPDPEDSQYKDFFQPLRSGTTGEATRQLILAVKNAKERTVYSDFYIYEDLPEGARVTAPEGAVRANLQPAAPVESRGPQEGPGQVTQSPGAESTPGVVPEPGT